MVTTLVRKELKESAWIWLIAAATYAIFVLDVMSVKLWPQFLQRLLPLGTDRTSVWIPFVDSQIEERLAWVSGIFGVCLGVWQSYGESWRGTFPLLLHTPIPRRCIFAVKLAVGLTLTAGLSALALVALSIWAATPGSHPAPFEWSMTKGAWLIWLFGPLWYLGGFTTGLYSARWLGTRLFPLVAVALAVGLIVVFANVLPTWGYVAATAIVGGVLVASIDYLVRTGDFS